MIKPILIIQRLSLAGAILLTPLMLIIYPYWIRFSNPNSVWDYTAWILLGAYPLCLLSSIVQLFKGQFSQAGAYSAPIILLIMFFVFPSSARLLSSTGFHFYRISHQAKFLECTLASFSKGNSQFSVGPCLQASNQGVPGFYNEKDFIIYDTSGMIAEPKSQHTLPWEEAIDQYVTLFGYTDYVVQKIGDNYFYVSFNLSSYGPAFRSNF